MSSDPKPCGWPHYTDCSLLEDSPVHAAAPKMLAMLKTIEANIFAEHDGTAGAEFNAWSLRGVIEEAEGMKFSSE